MTKIDDAANDAVAVLKAAEGVVFAYNAMSAENRAKLLQWHPTLNTNVQLLTSAYRKAFQP